ncbi:MAG: hypothetical protein P4M01_07920 [Acidobacteriota bacterium]|nr:hypothetical protein [Acidobacteriota bacterium]
MSATKPFYLRFALSWLLLCLAALALCAGFYWWLNWPDEHFWQVCASALWALLLLAAASLLARTTLAASGEQTRLLPCPRLVPTTATALWLLVFAAVEFALSALYEGSESVSVRLAQLAHLPPRFMIVTLHGILCAAAWFVVPLVLFPMGAALARGGFRGLRTPWLHAALRSIRYWSSFVAALVLFYGAHCLIEWIPARATLHGEIVSAAWRLSAAYLLAVTAVVIVSWAVPAGGRGDAPPAA